MSGFCVLSAFGGGAVLEFGGSVINSTISLLGLTLSNNVGFYGGAVDFMANDPLIDVAILVQACTCILNLSRACPDDPRTVP